MIPPEHLSSDHTVIAFLISIVSGFISIARRLMDGHPATVLWILCEFATAILCGYLMFDAYPIIEKWLPDWFTSPVAVAVSAHIGGRIFQEFEITILSRYKKLMRDQRRTPHQ